MSDNLKPFMKKHEYPVFEFPAPGVISENGEPETMRIRRLSYADVREINTHCTSQELLTDKKGKIVFNNGRPIWVTKTDNALMERLVLVKALEYPDLTDEALLAYYDAKDPRELPEKIWPSCEDYAAVLRAVGEVQKSNGIEVVSTEASPA